MSHARRLIAGLTFVLCSHAYGATLTYVGQLDGESESPPQASAGIGSASVIVDTSGHTMSIALAFSGLTGTTTASHIHCCTSPPGAGTAGVATQVPYFTGFPSGVTSGSFSNTFDLTQAATYNPAFVTNNGGIAAAEAALLAGLENGQAYLNIHTSVFPGGEIRAFLIDRIFKNGFN